MTGIQTVTRAKWERATVSLPEGLPAPDGGRLRSRVGTPGLFVILAEAGPHHGLWIYRRRDDPLVWAPIAWDRTRVPTRWTEQKNGVDIWVHHPTSGEVLDRPVVVTPRTPCKCGDLGKWRGPAWVDVVTTR